MSASLKVPFWRTFFRVTLPLLRPVLALVLVVTLIGSFQVFDTVQIATGGFSSRFPVFQAFWICWTGEVSDVQLLQFGVVRSCHV